MKYKVDWTSPRQGIRSTTVEALGLNQAKEQVESMYGNIEGFKVYCVSPVFEKQESTSSHGDVSINNSHTYSSSSGMGDISGVVGTLSLFAGGVIAIFGLITLPSGIVALVVGGTVGFLGMKLSYLLSDKGL